VNEGHPSWTADLVAFSRALHQLLDRPLVLEDPIAPRIISPRRKAALLADLHKYRRSRASKVLRASLVSRSRVAEDMLASAVVHGVTQYLVLGAGLDTFAYRNPYPGVRVFEVDHPSTQSMKRKRLAAAGISIGELATLVPFDLSGGSPAAALATAGFDASRPAVVAWLGVTMYLTVEEVRVTLRYLASLAPGTSVVFDYYLPVHAVGFVTRFVYKRGLRRLQATGEPWLSFHTPGAMQAELLDAGFSRAETLDRSALNARYLAGRRDRLDVGPLMQVAIATR
jgi:methyltransferase (TIGR00027 family)